MMTHNKRIVFDVGHPAQVHQFKNLCLSLQERGWEVLFTAKEKEMSIFLLEKYGLPYVLIGRSKKGLANKILGIPVNCFHFLRVLLTFRPSFVISRFSLHACWISFLFRKTHFGFADTEHVGFVDKITAPFVSWKLTSTSYTKDLGKHHVKYNGNIELFYLHPDRFNPDPEILNLLNLKTDEKFAIVRFISWDAHHDVNQKGFTLDEKIRLIQMMEKYVKVFITSEAGLPEELKKNAITFPAEKIHDVLAYATLYVGEGATMASEAACLGVPAVYVNSLITGYVEDEARSGLAYSFRDTKGVFEKTEELLQDPELTTKHKVKLAEFMQDKVDATGLILTLLDHWPESKKQLENNILSFP